MRTNYRRYKQRTSNWQGGLLAFGVTGAMAVALYACLNKKSSSSEVMIAPPGDFNPQQAAIVYDTNAPPTAPYVYSGGGNGSYLSGQGYYRVYGYPGYYYRPAPGTAVELVEGGSTGYSAGSPAEAGDNVARGGFGEGGEGEGHGGGGEGGGE